MASFTAKDVQALRQTSGAGMMDAKKALEENDGDMEAAGQWLREKGLASAAKRGDRENNQGAVAMAVNGNRAAIVELKSETDFSAKADDFTSLVTELAERVLAEGDGATGSMAAAIDDLKVTKKENIELGQVVVLDAADGNLLDTYLHVQDGRGVNAVVVEGSGVDADTLHQVALHVAFAKPTVLSVDDLKEADVEAERASLLDVTKAEGKPEAAWDKIVEGRLNAWFKEQVLLEQGLHGDKTPVKDTLGDGSIARFAQVYIGG